LDGNSSNHSNLYPPKLCEASTKPIFQTLPQQVSPVKIFFSLAPPKKSGVNHINRMFDPPAAPISFSSKMIVCNFSPHPMAKAFAKATAPPLPQRSGGSTEIGFP